MPDVQVPVLGTQLPPFWQVPLVAGGVMGQKLEQHVDALVQEPPLAVHPGAGFWQMGPMPSTSSQVPWQQGRLMAAQEEPSATHSGALQT